MSTRKFADASPPDALGLLNGDHERIRQLFVEFQHIKGTSNMAEKEALVQQICRELIVHFEVEEEAFYPAVSEGLGDNGLISEAEAEHANAKDLIEEIEALSPSHPGYNAKVTVLGEQMDQHIRAEQTIIFPKAKKYIPDLLALGEELRALKNTKDEQLTMGMPFFLFSRRDFLRR